MAIPYIKNNNKLRELFFEVSGIQKWNIYDFIINNANISFFEHLKNAFGEVLHIAGHSWP